jgi:cobalt-precorrin 5A hydrolase
MGGNEGGRIVIVAGIGCRQGTTVDELSAALEAALAAGGHDRGCLTALAIPERKRHEPALWELARAFGLPLHAIADEELLARAGDALTPSPSAAAYLGISVSPAEVAALAAAGPRSRLIAPRMVKGFVSCALAEALP